MIEACVLGSEWRRWSRAARRTPAILAPTVPEPPASDAGTTDAGADGLVTDGGAPDADSAIPLTDTCGDAGVIPGAWVADPHMCLSVYVDTDTGILALPRQMAFSPTGDLFVSTGGYVLTLRDDNHDGKIGVNEWHDFAGAHNLNHGLAFSPDGKFLYASTETTVFRWPYVAGMLQTTAEAEIVIDGMPTVGHITRTLVFDAQARLYVNIGSYADVDYDPALRAQRAQVRRYTIPPTIPSGGLAYDAGEIYASGVRNEVGLAFDKAGRFWGVENGSDGEFVNADQPDNPSDELNRLDSPGKRYFGYPECWTQFGFDGGPITGKQFAYQLPVGARDDAYCQNPANLQPPAAALRAHWAPLGIVSYEGPSFPWKGDLVLTAHGSAGRSPPVGRLLARAHVVGDAIVSVTPIVGHLVDGGLEEGTWDARPVDIRVSPDGAFFFSDNEHERIFRLGYRP